MKKYLLTMVALLCLGFTMNAQVNLQDGLVGYWPFNGNANDESGNGNHGTVDGAILTSDRFGNANSAYYFNGNSRILINSSSSLDLNDDLTIALWIKTQTSSHGLIFWRGDEQDGHDPYFVDISPDSLGFGRDIVPNHNKVTYNISSLNFNIFHFVVASYNSSTGQMNLYVDNNLVNSKTLIGSPTYSTSNFYNMIGNVDYYHFDLGFTGTIDDIRIYNRALNAQEITALYNEGQNIQATITIPDTVQHITQIIEIPIETTALSTYDNVISYQFNLAYDNTKLEYSSTSLIGTIAEGGIVSVNNSNPQNLEISYMTTVPLSGAGAILKIQFNPLQLGSSNLTISDFLYNTDTITDINNGVVTIIGKYGDVDNNDYVQAYDAALALQYSVGLDPLPTIDPLPWETWRIVVANVDGVGDVTANDASEILKYSVGLITTFPVEGGKKSGLTSNADILVSVENGEIILTSTGELYSLNVFVNENFSALGQAVNLVENALFVKNISETNYAFGLATAYSPDNNTNIIRIPYSATQNQNITFDMIVNTEVKSVSVGLTTGIVSINEQSIVLYPNPANSVLYLSGVVNANVSIFDISGRNVLNQLNVNEQIDISALPKGLYTVKIESKNESITRKLIKN